MDVGGQGSRGGGVMVPDLNWHVAIKKILRTELASLLSLPKKRFQVCAVCGVCEVWVWM